MKKSAEIASKRLHQALIQGMAEDVVCELTALREQLDPQSMREILLPAKGERAWIKYATAIRDLPVSTLTLMADLGGMPEDDAQAVALSKSQWEDWEHKMLTPPSRQSWLDEGLRMALASDDRAKVDWWLARGANLHHADEDGRCAVAALSNTRNLALLDWVLAQGGPLNASRKWDGPTVRSMRCNGRYDLLQRLVNAGADDSDLAWSDLHRVVLTGDAGTLCHALMHSCTHALMHSCTHALMHGESAQHLRAQMEALDSWQATPLMLAAHRGDTAQMQVLLDCGADLHAPWRKSLGVLHWALKSGRSEAVQWVVQQGVDVNMRDEWGATALDEAVERDDLAVARMLLALGANPNSEPQDDIGYTPMDGARSRAMLDLLMAHGGRVELLGRESTRVLLGLAVDDYSVLVCSAEDFEAYHRPREGRYNGEDLTNPFYLAMIRSWSSAYRAAQQFDLSHALAEPNWLHVWSANRNGQSLTSLPDGRWVQIGGEHEDVYVPDFYIYNDVSVHHPDGRIQVLGYPRNVFPPTDSHSATLVGNDIIIIGCRESPEQNQPGHTPVYALDVDSFQMRELECKGTPPGWIWGHVARWVDGRGIEVRGGEVETQEGKVEALEGVWCLDLEAQSWRCVDVGSDKPDPSAPRV